VIDGIGLSNKEVLEIRQSLAGFIAETGVKSVNVTCTHAHSSIDLQGLWGRDTFSSGRNGAYNAYVKALTVESMRAAYENRQDGRLFWGDILPDTDVFRDSRVPQVYEKSITRLRFEPYAGATPADDLYIACMGAHPECLGFQNYSLSADFPAYMGRYIAKATGGAEHADGTVTGGADFLIFNGAIGGLINGEGIDEIFQIMRDQLLLPQMPAGGTASNLELVREKMAGILGPVTGKLMLDTLDSLSAADFDAADRLSTAKKTELRKAYAKSYGYTIGRYVMAVDNEQEIDPILNIRLDAVMIPVENVLLELASALKLVDVNLYNTDKARQFPFVSSEAGYMELGDSLRILLAPGELAPEIALGGFLPAAESASGRDITRAPGFQTLRADGFTGKCLVFGLMNDELGYILPENDFFTSRLLPSLLTYNDKFGRGHYEESVSTGPKTAGILLDSWQNLFDATR